MKIHSELLQLNKTKQILKIWAKDFNRHCIKEDIQKANYTWKNVHPLIIREMKIKTSMRYYSHILECLKFKSDNTICYKVYRIIRTLIHAAGDI